jgi:translation elongation factor EF-G
MSENPNREPAIKTLQMFNKIDITMAEFQKDITYIKDSVKQNIEDHKEIVSKIDNLGKTFQGNINEKVDRTEIMKKLESFDKRYAPMAAWKIMIWAGGIIGAAILGGVIVFLAQMYKGS